MKSKFIILKTFDPYTCTSPERSIVFGKPKSKGLGRGGQSNQRCYFVFNIFTDNGKSQNPFRSSRAFGLPNRGYARHNLVTMGEVFCGVCCLISNNTYKDRCVKKFCINKRACDNRISQT